MYVDNNLMLSGSVSATGAITGQTVTGTGNVISTNVIDLGTARDMGEGQDLWARLQVTVAQAGATSVEAQVVVADDAAISTNVTVLGSTGAVPTASLTAGARLAIAINPRLGSRGQRYMAVRYVIVGTSSAGAFTADIGLEIQDFKTYAGGFAVL